LLIANLGAAVVWVIAIPAVSRAGNPPCTPPTLGFTDITLSAGVGGPSHFGGHGVAWADITDDARPDFYVGMHRDPTFMADLFYRNVNGATFVEEAALRGIDDFDEGSYSGMWADLDNDGDYDLVNGGYTNNHVRVFENTGAGFYVDRTLTAGILLVQRITHGMAAFDADNDGDLDILCVNWGPSGEDHDFYRNDGAFVFTRIDNGLQTVRGTQGVTTGDIDNDGDIDVVMGSYLGENKPLRIFRNDGGVFTLASNPEFAPTTGRQDGATLCDVNNDGWLDIHVARGDVGPNQAWLFINTGIGTSFTLAPVEWGTGFMAGFEDLDNDGDWDMVYPGQNWVWLWDGSGFYQPTPTFPIGSTNDPRTVAFADIDGDGDRDFAYGVRLAFNRLIRNNLSSGQHGWLDIRLTTANGQAGAFGAKVLLYESGQLGVPAGLICCRESTSQHGYLGQNDPVLHFGVGCRGAVDMRVQFLGGQTLDLIGVTPNQLLDVTPAPPPAPPILAPVQPNPDTAIAEREYAQFVVLLDGDAPITWSVLTGPAGLTVDNAGQVQGWTPATGSIGSTEQIRVRAANAGGEATVDWTVNVRALGDVNGDGPLDGRDVTAFVTCLLTGGAAQGLCKAADINGDGSLTEQDIAGFTALIIAE